MAKRITLIGMMILVLIGLKAINSKQQKHIERARDGQHIIIAPEEFLTQANLLADFYWNEFQIVRSVVDQQDIFDQMSGGVAYPEAILDYLIEFFDDPSIWMDSSVLIMGSGTEEWNTPNDKNRIVVIGYTDDEFVMLDTDYYPDIPIGRFPAQNIEQLELIINRNIQYITSPTLDWWRNKMLIVADDEHKGGTLEGLSYSSGLNHTARSQELAESLSDAAWIDRVLGIEYEMNTNGNKPEAAQDVIDKVNDGQLIWHFIGHGNEDVLGDEDYFRVSTQLQLLQNTDHLPLFTAASGSVGDFSSLEFDCMAEQFLTYEDGGAIASIAARAPTSGGSNSVLFLAFFQNIINDYQYLGAALLDAKINSGAGIINSKRFNILGDPLLFVNSPQRDENITIIGNPEILLYNDDISISGQLPSIDYSQCEFKAFESEYDCFYSNSINGYYYEVDYTKFGEPYFEEEIVIAGDYYETSFTVTSGIQTGEEARMISYVYSDEGDFVQYVYPITISDGTSSPDIPELPSSLVASNYPNPFNPSTTIAYSLPNDSMIELIVYNIKGQIVKTLVKGEQLAGTYETVWNGKDNNEKSVSSGIFFYKLTTKDETIMKKMLMLK
ncbi:MAG: T9SS type A sorting domain-containing protein [Candidatus Cloacimonetes bacterium]|nr:T9SS type A sorting domain-containing protein [Candidatus Cloacimonadota bacterium]